MMPLTLAAAVRDLGWCKVTLPDEVYEGTAFKVGIELRDPLKEKELLSCHLHYVRLDGKFGGLHVVDDEGHLTGIITDQDVFKVFATLAGARVPGIELTLEVSTGEGALKSVFEVLRQQGARVVSLMTQFGEGETRQVYIRLQQPESEERARAIRSALEAQWKLLEWTVAQG